ncbi:MAG: glutathione S-transferase family protein [Solirubrobacteraceae bacterium]
MAARDHDIWYTFQPVLLYDSSVSGNCYKVRLLLAHLGLSYERREVDVFERSGRAQLLEGLNPALRVPTLVLDDGRALAESNAILGYFGEETEYVPDDRFERAQMLQWMFFEQYSHEPYIAVARFWALAGITPSAEQLEGKRRGGQRALAAIDHHLARRRFLVADRYTLADIALFAYTHVAPEGGFELEPYPALREWLERVAAQPGHIAITA